MRVAAVTRPMRKLEVVLNACFVVLGLAVVGFACFFVYGCYLLTIQNRPKPDLAPPPAEHSIVVRAK